MLTVVMGPGKQVPFVKQTRAVCLAACTVETDSAPVRVESWARNHTVCVEQCYGMYGDWYCGAECRSFKSHE